MAKSSSSSMEMHFRSSLRDAANNKSPPCKLHRGCSGHLHGQGVLKVKSKVDPPPCHRSLAAARDSRSSSRSPVCYDRGVVPGYDLHRGYNNHHSSRETDGGGRMSSNSYAYNNHNNSSSRETDDSCYNSSSDVESSPVRKKSMLGLGKVLPAPASAECKSILPPRSPPKFLAFSNRSLSSSTCSSDQSSSSRYSGSTPSPGIYDYPSYSNPLQWPLAAAASSGLYLEEVSEELDDDLDQWSDHQHNNNNNNRRPSPSPSPCSTLASSTYESSIDQGRRLAMSPHQLRHSTPNRSPYTERNRPSNSSSNGPATTTTKKVTPSTLRRSTLNNNNNNNGSHNKGVTSSNGLDNGVGGKKKSAERIAATPLMKNKRVADLAKSGGQSSPSSRCSSPSLSRQNSAGSSSRSSLVSQRSTLDTLPKRPSSLTASGNQKQRTTVAAKPKSSSSSSAAIKKTGGPNRNSGSSQQPPTPQAQKEEESNESDQEAKSDDELTKEKEWIESGRVWLQHKDGFTSARLHPIGNGEEPVEEEGRVRLKLDATGELVSVDEDEVVKANPPQFDLAEDLAQLRHLNEASLLHTLRCRYAASLPHTYAGQSLVVINPVTPLAVYSERMIQLFRGCKAEDMPPHIYSSAQSAYRSMLATRCDQSLIFVGRSGSGKSHNFRNSLHYLCLAAGCPSKIITVEKLNSIFLLLEAFGNCRTALNTNATRFTNIFSLDFDQSGQIAAASIQVLMPERERVTRRPDGEPSFNVFYELVAGATGELRRYLQLDSVSGGGGPNAEPCAYMTPLQSAEDRQKAAVSYARLVAALESLGVAETDSRCIWSILAAIYHLGVAGAMRGVSNNKIVFARPAAAQRAAILLGIGSLEELAQLAFYATPVQGAMMNGRSSFRTGSPVHNADGAKLSMADKHLDPSEALEGFAQGLYVEAFSALVALINRSISSTARTISSIVAVDTPGFQNPATTTTSTTSSKAATFQDLCHNYTQERLQLLFHDTHITAQLNRYAQEHIDITLEGGTGEEEMPSPEPLVDLLDRAPQSAVARAQSATNLRDVERRGFLWLLDDEALVSTTSEDELLDKLSAMYNDRVFEKLFTRPEGTDSRKQLMIHHGQGTNSVLYDLDGWLKSAREMPTTRNAALALTESTKEEMASLFRSCRGPLPTTVSGSVAGIEGSQSLRRASSIRRTFTSGTAGIKRKSLALQLKFQVDGLIETLRRTKARFVYCFIPNHRAGLVDLSSSTFSANDDSLQVPLLRSQLRGSELLPAIRLYRQGYPDYMPLGEFVRRFNVLVPPDALPASLLTGLNSSTASEKQAAEILLLHIDMERSSYRLGLSQVFFRPGVLSQLEDQRDEKITNRVIKFQAQCRGFLARKRLSKLKVQDVAIRCIQRNVRKLQAVRVWPWWRLMLRLSPLLNVHRTEEELKARTEEAESLRSRVTALEKERADLKYVADRLETKVSELTADLAEEHSTAILATERLEAETAQRMKLDKDFSELEAKFRKLSGDHEKMEMEVLLNRSAGLNGSGGGGSEYNMMMSGAEDDDEEDDGQPNVFRQKCERLSRELELAKQRLAQQHEDDLEQTVTLKKQLEKKLNDAYEEVEEQRQVVAQWKRKSQRLAAELSDTRLLHEDQTNRNAVLEKKQRKFDTELQLLHDELRQERGNKERAMRDRDAAITDKLTSEQTLQSVQLDLEMRGERLAALTKELDEMTTEGRSDADMTALRRAKHELEMKVKDQEEELDELAGQVQLLESARLRLEMAMEQMRKENKKELAQREEEMEDTRCSAQKKVKALEAQLESEHEERTLLVREKHELERQLLSMAQHAAHAADDDTIHKLKRDLKRTKALLKDAHSQLERCRSETPSKVLLRQLKNQLEDSEFARTAAVKGRQHAEQELLEAQQQLDEALRLRGETEDKYLSCNRERSNYQSQVDDLEVELNEVMRKYKAAVAQLSVDQITLQDQTAQLMTLEHEKSTLKEQVAELSARLECLEIDTKSVHTQKRMELKVKELESRVELEQTSKSRLETQVSRLKEMLDKSNLELDSLRCKEQLSQESSKRLQRQLRDVREELTGSEQRDADTSQQLREFEQRIELLESENATLVKDLSLALRRIEDLQVAMQGEMDTSDSDQDPHSVDSDSDDDSDTSFHTFLSQRKYGSTSGVSSASDARRQSPTGLDSPSSSRVDLTSSLDKPEDESVA
ncbi:unconventional myosin-XVIIIa-like isoform X2 [Daphnia pulex]|uniref:unconventional myosin-XVIIIa-like isoform X2 n=1 Tax=Daphnia pulex TaxID=6669 RepID=UPI001EDF303E|nr:unconventional myosin-XVIIIa-like isoform X2 [Daphnia pulex]